MTRQQQNLVVDCNFSILGAADLFILFRQIGRALLYTLSAMHQLVAGVGACTIVRADTASSIVLHQ
jgi:hypothetical protein